MADLADLKPDRRNANKGTVRGRALLEDSLRRHGAGRSILADKHGNVIAGNKTLESAADIGLPVRFVQTDGTELVVVQRTDLDLDSDSGRSLAYLDNRVAELDLSWDVAELLADRDAGLDLAGVGFDADELAELLAMATREIDTAPPNLDPGEGRYKEQYGVIVICGDESEQERVYNDLLARGYECRVVVT